MSLSLIFLLLGTALVAGGSIPLRASTALAVRSSAAAAVATGALMVLIGLVNALSGTM